MSKTKIGQIGLPGSQIGLLAGIGFPVRVRAYSRSENPNLILNNITNHNSKTHTGRKLNNMVEKFLGYASGYVSQERGATDLPILLNNRTQVLKMTAHRYFLTI